MALEDEKRGYSFFCAASILLLCKAHNSFLKNDTFLIIFNGLHSQWAELLV